MKANNLVHIVGAAAVFGVIVWSFSRSNVEVTTPSVKKSDQLLTPAPRNPLLRVDGSSFTPKELNAIKEAREAYARLAKEEMPDYAVPYIERKLGEAHASYADLDLTGKTTNEDIKSEVDARYKQAHLLQVRHLFDELPRSDLPDIKMDLIKIHMKKGKVTYKDIDSTGQKTEQEMKAEVDTRYQQAHLVRARHLFDRLGRSDLPDIDMDLIKDHMKKAKATYKDIDSKGQKTEQEMKAEVDTRYQQAHLVRARYLFDRLGRSDLPDIDMDLIKDHMAKAKATYKDLDPEGKKTEQQMRAKFDSYGLKKQMNRPEQKFQWKDPKSGFILS